MADVDRALFEPRSQGIATRQGGRVPQCVQDSRRVPDDWPSLTVTGVHDRDFVFDITAHASGRVQVRQRPSSRLPATTDFMSVGR